jgi:hypothetical protein
MWRWGGRGCNAPLPAHNSDRLWEPPILTTPTVFHPHKTAPNPTKPHPPQRFLPDKAIDLVDEAAAKLKMEITSKPTALDEVDRRVLQLEMERLSLAKAAPNDKGAASR